MLLPDWRFVDCIGFTRHTLLVEGVFFLFAIIVVVAYHVILIVLWAAPMTTRMQKQFFLTAQVLNAWSLASTLGAWYSMRRMNLLKIACIPEQLSLLFGSDENSSVMPFWFDSVICDTPEQHNAFTSFSRNSGAVWICILFRLRWVRIWVLVKCCWYWYVTGH